MIKVGLQLRGHAEVVHRQAQHDDVGAAHLVNQRVALGDDGLLLGRAGFGRRQKGLETRAVQMRQRLSGEVADHHLGLGVARGPRVHEALGQLG